MGSSQVGLINGVPCKLHDILVGKSDASSGPPQTRNRVVYLLPRQRHAGTKGQVSQKLLKPVKQT